MPRQVFVDFKAVKAAITIEQVLSHYDIMERFKRNGDSLSGPCPLHEGENPTQFRISLSKNIWNCFSKCKCGGNVLDFISKMENVSIHGAAVKAIEWFHLDPDALTARSDEASTSEPAEKEASSKAASKREKTPVKPEKFAPNPPLKFRLDKLERDHPYLAERGLTSETIAEFGLGYCTKGMMMDRIAIPIANAEGHVLAYAGRYPGEPDDQTPKYKLPPGFKKSQELFNLDRAIREPDDTPLVIVEGFFDCMALYQSGCRKVVALMGSSLSPVQEGLVRHHVAKDSRVIVMLDENEAGQAGRDDIASRLAKHCFVHVHVFDEADSEPEHLTAEEIAAIVG